MSQRQNQQMRIAVTRKIRNAIREPKTREEIAEETCLEDEVVSHVITELWDAGDIKFNRETREFQAA